MTKDYSVEKNRHDDEGVPLTERRSGRNADPTRRDSSLSDQGPPGPDAPEIEKQGQGF